MRSRVGRWLTLGSLSLGALCLDALCLSSPAAAAKRLYVIAIGNNAVPSRSSDPKLRALRFADDDAAAFQAFAAPFAHRSTLLSLLDKRTQRRFAEQASQARAPTLSALRAVVKSYRAAFLRDRKAGHEPELWIYFSGHGTRPKGAPAGLAFTDGALTQARLYDDILAGLPARYVHLFVDACYAEAVVHARGGDDAPSAEVVTVNPAEAGRWLARDSLRRFPHVGAVIAASQDQVTHEWAEYEQGVFTQQLLSGLRGAADVNGDGRVEYSEIQAFLTAANQAVKDPRARLDVVVRAPSLNLRQPIVELKARGKLAWLTGVSSTLGRFHIEDSLGRRIVDAHLEPGHRVSLTLPPGQSLFLRSSHREAAFRLRRGQRMNAGTLRFTATQTQERGAVVAALRQGLFTTAYGPRYYRGFVGHTSAVAVAFTGAPHPADAAAEDSHQGSVASESRLPAALSFGVSGALAVSTGIFGGLMVDAQNDFDNTTLQRPAADAKDRHEAYRAGLIVSAAASAAALGLGLWLYPWEGSDSALRAGLEAAPDGVAWTLRGHW